MTKRKPNINDIAQAAGVSKTTVSRYLNGHTELMSESTSERIKAIIEISNYHPSDIARNLKRKRTNLIGVIAADMTSPFSASLIVSIGEYLMECGYVPLFANSGNSLHNEKNIVDMLLSKDVAGLLINTTSFVNPDLISVACTGVPIVLCDRYIQNYRLNIVTMDNAQALHTVVKHLRDQGYTRLAFFTQDPENNSTRIRRQEAFHAAVNAIYGSSGAGQVCTLAHPDVPSACAQLERFMESLRPGDVPAVICTNSITTVLTYKAIRSMSLQIPSEMGLCGPDDWDWDTDMLWSTLAAPDITTFSIPTKQMGREAAALLVDLLNHPEQAPHEVLLPSELRVRNSTMRRRES